MPQPLYKLIDGPLLKRLMKRPDQGGQRHTVRSLSVVTGISRSKISNMTRDHMKVVTAEQATATAEAVGVNRKALFTPELFSFENRDTGGITDGR